MIVGKRCFLSVLLLIVLLLSSCGGTTESAVQPTAESDDVSDKETGDFALYTGDWEGVYKTQTYEADVTIHIFDTDGKPEVFIKNIKEGFFTGITSSFSDNQLTLLLNDEEHRATISLNYTDDKLVGTLTQYGGTYPFCLTRISYIPTKPSYPNLTYAERLQQLTDNEDYENDGTVIPFTYELNNREPWLDIIKTQGEITDAKTDIEIMKDLLYWVSDNFKHGNPDGSPANSDAMSIIEFAETTGGYINCRGLSKILADLCRVYGIHAKHITCMPKERYFNDCHVVVHAYSSELGQWVMLDPTYKLILQDEDGKYIDLPSLRSSLIHGKKIIANKEFSYNGSKNNASIEYYREYMTKNTFRFESATDFYYGVENGDNGNSTNMLIPVGYTEDSADVTTTSPEAFWAAP